MGKGIFIIGIDTDVGKTVVTAGLLYKLRSNQLNASYFKPVLSGAREENNRLIPGDVEFVKKVSNLKEETSLIAPYIFKTPASPHLASYMENNIIDIENIKSNYKIVQDKYDYIICEGAGGLMVPLNKKGYMLYDLIKELKLDVIIVSSSSLGSINHCLLTIEGCKNRDINIKSIIFNRYDRENIIHRDNVNTIKKISKIPILGLISKLDKIDVERELIGDIREFFQSEISLDKFLECFN